MPYWLVFLLAAGFLARDSYQRPRGVYLCSVLGVLLVTLGSAAFWLLMSPSNEAGFGFFGVCVVIVALALAAALAACLGATARHGVDALSARRA